MGRCKRVGHTGPTEQEIRQIMGKRDGAMAQPRLRSKTWDAYRAVGHGEGHVAILLGQAQQGMGAAWTCRLEREKKQMVVHCLGHRDWRRLGRRLG